MSRHGTLYRYQQGCACRPCTAANSAYHREWKARQRIVPLYVRHGTGATYSNYGCRCGPCSDAHSTYMRAYRHEVRAYKQRRQEAAR